jgi:hypothetical protein
MVKVIEIISFVTTVITEWRNFTLYPRKVIEQRKENWDAPAKVYKIVGSVISLIALLTALYAAMFGSFYSNIQAALFDAGPKTLVVSKTTTTSSPKFVDWGVHPGISIGISFPHAGAKAPTQPQLVVFSFGAAIFVYEDVIPDKIMSGSSPLLLQLLYGLLLALCLHPFAKMLKGNSSFQASAKYSLLLVSYTLGTAFVMALITATLFIEFGSLRGLVILLPWSIFVLIPFIVIGARGFFAGFSELYSISKKRVLLASLGAWGLTSIITPIIFWPVIHAVLVFQPYLDAVI